MTNWSQAEATPDTQRFNLYIFRQDMPEVADYLCGLPWGTSSEVIRSLIVAGHAALKAAGQLPNVDLPVQARRRGKVAMEGRGERSQPASQPAYQPQPVQQTAQQPVRPPAPQPAYQPQPAPQPQPLQQAAQQPVYQPQPAQQLVYQTQPAQQLVYQTQPVYQAPAAGGDAMSDEDLALLADLDSGLS